MIFVLAAEKVVHSRFLVIVPLGVTQTPFVEAKVFQLVQFLGFFQQVLRAKRREEAEEEKVKMMRVAEGERTKQNMTHWHRRTGSKICGGSLFNSKSHRISSPTEIPSIRGLQRALESLKEPQRPQKSLRNL